MHRISQLFIKRLTSRLTPSEEAELQSWANENDGNYRLYKRLTDPKAIKESLDIWQMVDSRRACRDMQNKVDRILWRSRLRNYAAIAIALLTVAGIISLFNMDSGFHNAPTPVADANNPCQETVDDIRPGITRAMLSDAAGNNIILTAADTARTATVLSEIYDVAEDSPEKDLCLNVPRGGEFKIQLEDGTDVWLNSESKLYYPKTFDGDIRKIRVEGEAYMTVATDSLRPFYVETDNQLVRVYGTSFNIRYYPEENEIYTTLEKGKISLRRNDNVGGEFFLTPGHQAVFGTKDSKVFVRPVDTEVVTSWRNGRFVFEHQTLLRIMQDLGRWYDFEYEFSDESLKKEVFMGSIPRYSDFTTAISILEKCGGIRFAIDEGKVMISHSDRQPLSKTQ